MTFFTIGSANMVDLSLEADHTELNIAVWNDPSTAHSLRMKLFNEHLAGDSTMMKLQEEVDQVKQFQRFMSIANHNGEIVRSGQSPSNGMAFSLDPVAYGIGVFAVSLYLEHWHHC